MLSLPKQDPELLYLGKNRCRKVEEYSYKITRMLVSMLVWLCFVLAYLSVIPVLLSSISKYLPERGTVYSM